MRLLFVSNVPRTLYSGMGRWTHHIAKELASSGHTTTEWYAEELALPVASQRFHVFVAPLFIAMRLWRHRREFNVALIHEPSAWPSALLARLFPRSMPAVIAVSHGVETHAKREYLAAAKLGFFTYSRLNRLKHMLFVNWQSDLGLRLCWKALCLNRKDDQYIQQVLGRAAEDVIVINNGMDPSVDLPTMPPPPRDPQTVLMLSAWREYKGTLFLPSLWETVRKACPQALLKIVGTVSDADTVLSSFSPEARSSVEVIPKVHDRESMHLLLLSATVFLMPSIQEGSPLALIEAMACGLPVVASIAGGIPDILCDGVYGRIFDWRDPSSGAADIIELLKDPQEQKRLADLARARALELTWSAAAAPVLAALSSMKQA